MPTAEQIEEFLKEHIFPELEKGRAGFDMPHTQAVVFYLKEILNNSPSINVDNIVLLIAAYAHDWGYADLFTQGKPINYEEVKNAKKLHMELGVQKIHSLLKDPFFSFITTEQKERIIHLVGIHDKLVELKEIDELVLMEADTLGGLDIKLITPFKDKESNIKYIEGVKAKRVPLFITEFGKSKVEELIKKREQYASQLQHD